MKEYIKPSVQVIDIKVKDDVTAVQKGTGYYVKGGKITYYVLQQNASGETKAKAKF